MPLQIIHRDITTINCDVIVNPTDCRYSGSGGTDLAIHRAAGQELNRACRELPSLNPGEVSTTPGFNLPCRYIIHTVGPVWEGGDKNETTLLRSCYTNALIKAKRLGVKSIAFPLISSGTFRFPKDKVLRIATEAIADFLFAIDSDMDVTICILNRDAYETGREAALKEYIECSKSLARKKHALKFDSILGKAAGGSADAGSVLECIPAEKESCPAPALMEDIDFFDEEETVYSCSYYAPEPHATEEESVNKEKPIFSDHIQSMRELRESDAFYAPEKKKESKKLAAPIDLPLEKWIKKQDDTFAVLLLKLIDKKGIGDVECYKKANVSKNTFWKINNDPKYRPSKQTVIAFAIALELTIVETEALLKSAGFALSRNNEFDLIIEFCIINGIYSTYEINEILYKHDQVCLGC